MNPVAIAGVSVAALALLYAILKDEGRRGSARGCLTKSVSEHAKQLAKQDERITNLERTMERRRDAADLVRMARVMAEHTPDAAGATVIRSVLDRYDGKTKLPIVVIADKI